MMTDSRLILSSSGVPLLQTQGRRDGLSLTQQENEGADKHEAENETARQEKRPGKW